MGQTLLVMGALTMLSLAVLSANRIILDKYTDQLDSQATMVAISLAQAKADDVTRRAFDENSITRKIYDSTRFTAVAFLGKESGESSQALYDDIDDFNDDSSIVHTATLDTFTVRFKVYYVRASDPNTISSSQSFYKEVKITVSYPSMRQAVVVRKLVVYRRYE